MAALYRSSFCLSTSHFSQRINQGMCISIVLLIEVINGGCAVLSEIGATLGDRVELVSPTAGGRLDINSEDVKGRISRLSAGFTTFSMHVQANELQRTVELLRQGRQVEARRGIELYFCSILKTYENTGAIAGTALLSATCGLLMRLDHNTDPQVAADDHRWRTSNPKRCQITRTEEACASIASYLKESPSGRHAAEAEMLIDELDWKAADVDRCVEKTKLKACDGVIKYLKGHKNRKHSKKAHRVIRDLENRIWSRARVDECSSTLTREACEIVVAYVNHFPEGIYADEANRIIEELVWAETEHERCSSPKTAADCDAVAKYIRTYEQGAHVDEAKQIILSVKAEILRLRDDAAWNAAEDAACRKDLTDESCAGVANYVSLYGDGGRHSAAAVKLIAQKDGANESRIKAEEKKSRNEERKSEAESVKWSLCGNLRELDELLELQADQKKIDAASGTIDIRSKRGIAAAIIYTQRDISRDRSRLAQLGAPFNQRVDCAQGVEE